MAIDDRDWYRELHRKKEGYIETAPFRVDLSTLKPKPRPHWVLVLLATSFICLGLYAFLRLLQYVMTP